MLKGNETRCKEIHVGVINAEKYNALDLDYPFKQKNTYILGLKLLF